MLDEVEADLHKQLKTKIQTGIKDLIDSLSQSSEHMEEKPERQGSEDPQLKDQNFDNIIDAEYTVEDE